MSSLTVVQSKSSNDYRAATSYKSATFTAVGSGNSLVMIITALTAELPFVIEPQAYNGTTDVPMVLISTDTSVAGVTRHLYKLDNITHAPTSIRYKVNASSGSTQQASTVLEIGNTGGLALTMRVDQKTYKPGTTSFSESFTTVSANEMVIANLRMNLSNPGVSATAPALLVTHGNSNTDDLYNVDVGASGLKSIAWTTVSSPNTYVWITTFSNTSSTPNVTSVTGASSNEGASIVYTVALSGPTSATSNFPASFSGTATSADYNNALGSATYSDGVTASGSDLVVPSGVSSFTVTIATTQDALDEDNETLVLRVGGVDSTGGTITDDDASPALLIPGPVTVDSGDSVVASYTLGVVSGRVTQARLTLTDGTKVGGVDYTNVITDPMLSDGVTISAGVLSIPAGVAGFTITIPTAA